MAEPIAGVYFKDRLAGYLKPIAGGYSFQYAEDYLKNGIPIAYTLPLRSTAYEGKRLPPFFDNLVSEGWLKRQQSQTQKIDENDHFRLLLENGQDLPGAVSIKPL